MTKHRWLLFVSFLNAFVLRARHSFVSLLCVLLLFCSTDCWFSASDLRWSQPNTPIIQICDKPLGVPDDVNLWGYDFVTKRLVTAEDPAELRLFDNADAFFEYNPDAPASSALEMPSEYGLTCVKRVASFADTSVHSFPPSSDLFRSQEPCPAQVAETVHRANRGLFADTMGGKKPCETPVQKDKPKGPVRVYVCARPPSVGNVSEWGILDVKGIRLTRSETDFQAEVTKAKIIFVFDTTAAPESVYWFVQDPKKLVCPNKPAPRPYDQVIGSGMLEVINAATAMGTALNPGTPKKGDGQTTWSSGPDGKGPPLSHLEAVVRQLMFAGALASGDTSGDPKDPNGARYGATNGKNAGGVDSLLVQAVAGTIALVGVPLKSPRAFIDTIRKGLQKGEAALILDPEFFSKDVAKKLAEEPKEKAVEEAFAAIKRGEEPVLESFGKAMAPSLQEAKTIMPYSRAEIFTAGWEGKFQAHHILEVEMGKEVFFMEKETIENIPAIILTDTEHKAFTKALNEARATVLKGTSKKYPDKQQLWAIYKDVYKSKPTWLEAIESYFK